MPEGDTLFRTAAALRPHLVDRVVVAARARVPGPRVERLVGVRITAVDAVGKNLLVRFENGLELRTHLRMHGSWHRYRPGERWRRPPARAVLVLEVDESVAVCFDAPVVELLETRAEGLHPPLAALGPDATADGFDGEEALRRLREPARAELTIAEALLDQRALAGIGNVYKSEVLFVEGVDPFAAVASLDDAALGRLVDRARALLLANRSSVTRVTVGPAGGGGPTPLGPGVVPPGRGRLWVYGRAGRPCRRCGTLVRARRHGALPRTMYWCPRCQPAATGEEAGPGADGEAGPDAGHAAGPGREPRGGPRRGYRRKGVTMTDRTIDVRCGRDGAGWLCLVRVREGAFATEHRVTVAGDALARLDPDAPDPERLVRAAFDFLLEREPASSILRSFDLPVIGRYFPGWEDDVRGRLRG